MRWMCAHGYICVSSFLFFFSFIWFYVYLYFICLAVKVSYAMYVLFVNHWMQWLKIYTKLRRPHNTQLQKNNKIHIIDIIKQCEWVELQNWSKQKKQKKKKKRWTTIAQNVHHFVNISFYDTLHEFVVCLLFLQHCE